MQGKKTGGEVPIRYIKGVGPVKSEVFGKVGIQNVSDLFYYLPRKYEDRTRIVDIKDLVPGESQGVIGEVLKTSVFTTRTGRRIFEMSVGDESSRVFAVWYNQPFLKKMFVKGQKVILYGKVEVQKRLQLVHPAFEIIDEEKSAKSLEIGRIVPFYPLTEGLSQRELRKVVFQAMHSHLALSDDPLPTSLRARKKLVDFKFAVSNIHFPHSEENLERAYKRLIFEEFFILQTTMALRRKKMHKKGIQHSVHEGLMLDFEKLFDFTLTSEQKKCIKEIGRDMSDAKPMYRLLQGDVGSGKTVVAMYALLLAAGGAYQGAMMAPTEVLARQHYVTLSKAFMPLGINVRLLVSGIDQSSSDRIKKEIAEGEADIVIGTHSLIQEEVEYKNLGLVVIDEQHKFGVEQRKKLAKKGEMPDTLIMTATPIPRSLMLTAFGDMDTSLLKEKPGGREPVATYWADESKREVIYEFIKDEVKKSHQAFIVYPRIKETGRSSLKSAEEMYAHLKTEVFSEFKIALVHGQMKSKDKEKIMDDFRKGKYDILVATTIIEVGVDIPNVTVMLVENAERYGLAQLHQLRGRIGRGKDSSYCILLGDSKTEASSQRLSIMAEESDGFKIAEKDLDIRGPGEFLGTRQSGLPELKVGNIVRDFAIMEEAREEAFSLVNEDPNLIDPHNAGIRKSITERFRGKFGI